MHWSSPKTKIHYVCWNAELLQASWYFVPNKPIEVDWILQTSFLVLYTSLFLCPLKPLPLPFLFRLVQNLTSFFYEQKFLVIFFYSLINIHLNFYFSSKITQSSVAQYLHCSPKGIRIYKWVRVDYLDLWTKATFKKLGQKKWEGSRDDSNFYFDVLKYLIPLSYISAYFPVRCAPA